jgi:uncharacterized protein
VFDFFLEQGISEYALNFVCPPARPGAAPGTPVAHYVEPARVSAFLRRLYDRWREHDDPSIRIRDLDSLRRTLVGGPAGFCVYSGACFGVAFRVEPNGDVGQCDYFQGDPEYTWGNVLTHDFAALRASPKLQRIQAQHRQALRDLQACPNFAVCHGGCPFQRYVSGYHNPQHRSDCCGLSDLVDHLRLREAEPRATRARDGLQAAAPTPQPSGVPLRLDLSRRARPEGGVAPAPTAARAGMGLPGTG